MLEVTKKIIILVIMNLVAMFFLACSNITEQDMIYDAGLHLVSADNLQIVNTIPGIKNASSLMLYPGKLFVASSGGIVRSYDSNDLSLLGEHIVGVASPAGYFDLTFSPTENTAYLIGAMGKILELSLPDCEVIDEFSVCLSPIDMTITSGSPGDLWVADGPSNSVVRVDIETNESLRVIQIVANSVINELVASNCYHDSLLIATTNLIGRLEATDEVGTRLTFVQNSIGASWSGLCPIPHDSNFVAVSNGTKIGECCVYDKNAYPGYPPPSFYNTDTIENSNWITAAGNDYINVYALGSLGDGTSRLYRYTYIGPSYGINGFADFAGYPIDLKISDSGQIYVLTVEQ